MRHAYYETPAQQQAREHREAQDNEARKGIKRQGVRILADGTRETYTLED